ncbi:MAG: DNA-protecting protein DprA [candidate division Zixibacteria bacterium]|nr:DNA-protecting protein DprA [candidate division Zixibacteria bacterium]
MTPKENAAAAILALAAVGKIGPVRLKAILTQAGDPTEITAWDERRFCEVPGISSELAGRIRQKLDIAYGQRLIEWAAKHDFRITTLVDSDYPPMLRAMYDVPPFLFLAGQWTEADNTAVAIVGSRNASEYGKTTAFTLAAELAHHGITVVSGLAIGVDAASHRGAMSGDGRTIAVLGSGIDIVYPPNHAGLFNDIRARGVVLSEFFPGVGPNPGHFPRRNRVIAGLAQAVVVVEAGSKSGALLTADLALSQGKKLFAVPGSVGSQQSLGTNELIKAGAYLLTSAEDIFTVLPELKRGFTPPAKPPVDSLNQGERLVYNYLSVNPVQFDAIVRHSGLAVGDVSAYLLSLELRGMVRQLSGKRFIVV